MVNGIKTCICMVAICWITSSTAIKCFRCFNKSSGRTMTGIPSCDSPEISNCSYLKVPDAEPLLCTSMIVPANRGGPEMLFARGCLPVSKEKKMCDGANSLKEYGGYCKTCRTDLCNSEDLDKLHKDHVKNETKAEDN